MSAAIKCSVILLAISLNSAARAATNDLTLSLPDFSSTVVAPFPDQTTPAAAADTQTVIPPPPAAWTGMFGLGALGVARCRKSLRRFLS